MCEHFHFTFVSRTPLNPFHLRNIFGVTTTVLTYATVDYDVLSRIFIVSKHIVLFVNDPKHVDLAYIKHETTPRREGMMTTRINEKQTTNMTIEYSECIVI